MRIFAAFATWFAHVMQKLAQYGPQAVTCRGIMQEKCNSVTMFPSYTSNICYAFCGCRGKGGKRHREFIIKNCHIAQKLLYRFLLRGCILRGGLWPSCAGGANMLHANACGYTECISWTGTHT